MSTESAEIEAGWEPPRSLRDPLWWGFVGAIVAGGLAIAASLAELLELPGFETWGGALELVATVPLIPVLVAFLRLGRASSDATAGTVREKDGLARAAVCLFGLMWLTAAKSFALDFLLEWESVVAILVSSFLTLLVLFGLISHATKEGAWPIVLLAFFAIRYGLGWWLVGKKLPFEVALPATTAALMVGCGVVFPIWFAVALWTRRDRLGAAAGVLAAAVVAGLFGFLAVIGWVIVTAVRTPNLLDRIDEIDALFKPHVQAGLTVTLLADALAALAAALLFRGVAARIPPEPDPEPFEPEPGEPGTDEPPAEPEVR